MPDFGRFVYSVVKDGFAIKALPALLFSEEGGSEIGVDAQHKASRNMMIAEPGKGEGSRICEESSTG